MVGDHMGILGAVVLPTVITSKSRSLLGLQGRVKWMNRYFEALIASERCFFYTQISELPEFLTWTWGSPGALGIDIGRWLAKEKVSQWVVTIAQMIDEIEVKHWSRLKDGCWRFIHANTDVLHMIWICGADVSHRKCTRVRVRVERSTWVVILFLWKSTRVRVRLG